jgi:hypothetical protein
MTVTMPANSELWVKNPKSVNPVLLVLRDDVKTSTAIEQATVILKLPLAVDAYNLLIGNEAIKLDVYVASFAAQTSVENPAIIGEVRGKLFTR